MNSSLLRRNLLGFLNRLMAVLLLSTFIVARATASQPAASVPIVDRSTPAAQNGYTLLAVQPSADTYAFRYIFNGAPLSANPRLEIAARLWIKPPDIPADVPSDDLSVQPPGLYHIQVWRGNFLGDFPPPAFTVQARSSTDAVLNLSWEIHGTGKKRLLFVPIPIGYPDSFAFFDVTITDQHGKSATWRITHLPRSQHPLNPPLSLDASQTKNGVQVTVQAWHGPDPNIKIGFDSVFINDIVVEVTVNPPASQIWQLSPSVLHVEWEGAMRRYFPIQLLIGTGAQKPFFGQKSFSYVITNIPYGNFNHFLAFSVNLLQISPVKTAIQQIPMTFTVPIQAVPPNGKSR